jgi:hypothetical protein
MIPLMIPFDFIESSASLETQGFIKLCSSPTTQLNFSQHLTKSKSPLRILYFTSFKAFLLPFGISHNIYTAKNFRGIFRGADQFTVPSMIFPSLYKPVIAVFYTLFIANLPVSILTGVISLQR